MSNQIAGFARGVLGGVAMARRYRDDGSDQRRRGAQAGGGARPPRPSPTATAPRTRSRPG